MKDTGEAKQVHVFELNRDRSNRSLFLYQSKQAEEILEHFGMQNSRLALTPFEASSNSDSELFLGSSKSALDVPYHKVAGNAMHR